MDARLRMVEQRVAVVEQADKDTRREVDDIKADIGDIKKWVLGTMISAILGLFAALWELALRVIK